MFKGRLRENRSTLFGFAVQPLCEEVNAKFKTVQEKFKALANKIPQGQYYR